MKSKIIGILILIIGVILIAGILYYFFAESFGLPGLLDLFKKDNNSPVVVTKPDNTKTEPVEIIKIPDVKVIDKIQINTTIPESNENNVVIEPADLSKDELIRLAESFSERFGSYSNQSNFSNIKSLKIFMSLRMKERSDEFIKEQLSSGADNSIYYGITTKAISSEILDYDDDVGTAKIKVQTRRREATSSTNNLSNVFAQDIIINLIKERGAWKVGSANWQN